MYCKKCGAEVKDTAEYCHKCGYHLKEESPTDDTAHKNADIGTNSDGHRSINITIPDIDIPKSISGQLNNLSQKTTYLVVMLLTNAFVTAGILFKSSKGTITDRTVKSTLIDFFKLVDRLDEWGFDVESYTAIKVWGVIAIVISIASALLLLNAVLNVKNKEISKVTKSSKISVFLGLASMLIQCLTILLFNSSLVESYSEIETFVPTLMAWLVMIVAVVHICYISKKFAEILSSEGIWSH
ncbi:MAG: zinc ribbon domain-containing protein [Butyrivibrio sp.]|nr:zinc ribbon domain-containing protein [Butyrivibrio sp.]